MASNIRAIPKGASQYTFTGTINTQYYGGVKPTISVSFGDQPYKSSSFSMRKYSGTSNVTQPSAKVIRLLSPYSDDPDMYIDITFKISNGYITYSTSTIYTYYAAATYNCIVEFICNI